MLDDIEHNGWSMIKLFYAEKRHSETVFQCRIIFWDEKIVKNEKFERKKNNEMIEKKCSICQRKIHV